MRVPTNSNSDQMIQRISDLSARQAKLQTQVSTGQRIFQPEDDPAAMGRVLSLKSEKSQLTQFKTNAAYALDLSNATYSALTSINKISDRAGEIATLSTGSITTETYDAYAEEVNQLIEQGTQLANTKLGNNYLFAGTNLSSPAYTRTPPTGDIASVTYAGNASQVTIPLSENSSIAPGSTTQTNNDIATFINDLIALRDALKSKDPAAVATVKENLIGSDTISGDENNIVNALSAQGAIQMRIEISNTQRTARLDNIDKLVSGEVDVDLPEAITKLSQATTAYEAALQSTSRIMQISLLDYLK
ncbi:MAG: flagellin [Opitutaceae bacterium]|jgi:flagellar hook-associated protein 3 FlgL